MIPDSDVETLFNECRQTGKESLLDNLYFASAKHLTSVAYKHALRMGLSSSFFSKEDFQSTLYLLLKDRSHKLEEIIYGDDKTFDDYVRKTSYLAHNIMRRSIVKPWGHWWSIDADSSDHIEDVLPFAASITGHSASIDASVEECPEFELPEQVQSINSAYEHYLLSDSSVETADDSQRVSYMLSAIHSELTKREFSMLHLMCESKSVFQISDILDLSVKSTQNLQYQLNAKLESIRSNTSLVSELKSLFSEAMQLSTEAA